MAGALLLLGTAAARRRAAPRSTAGVAARDGILMGRGFLPDAIGASAGRATVLAPAVVLVFLLLSVNFLGDSLRDALDPSSKSGGEA